MDPNGEFPLREGTSSVIGEEGLASHLPGRDLYGHRFFFFTRSDPVEVVCGASFHRASPLDRRDWQSPRMPASSHRAEHNPRHRYCCDGSCRIRGRPEQIEIRAIPRRQRRDDRFQRYPEYSPWLLPGQRMALATLQKWAAPLHSPARRFRESFHSHCRS